MLTGRQLLLPSLDLLLPRECIGLEHGVNKRRKLSSALIDIVNPAFVAFDLCCCIIAVGFGLGSDRQLSNLLPGLVALDLLSCTLDVQNEGMARRGDVEECVISVTCAPAVEAVEANIEAGGVVLGASLAEVALRSFREAHTIESKHWVQSSRYTDCVGPGTRSSAKR
jgi:hypothetical protein